MLFDASGQISLQGINRAGRRHDDIEVVRGEGVTGLRIPASADVLVSASANENSWTFTLGARADAGTPATLTRETLQDGRGRLTAQFGREGSVRWINDPEIGDRIAVALVGGPARGVNVRRATLEAAVLPSRARRRHRTTRRRISTSPSMPACLLTRVRAAATASSLPAAPNVRTRTIARRRYGRRRRSPDAPLTAQSAANLVQVRETIDRLMRQAADEGVGEGAPVEARMALARYLLQHDFAAEALGALRIVAINQGELVEIDPEYRLMRAAANVMMGRTHAAQTDLSASSLANNPSAALWRGYAASIAQDWSTARRELGTRRRRA